MVDKEEFQCSLNLNLNPACGDSTGSERIEKDKVVYLLNLFKEGGRRWDLVCLVHLDDRVHAGLC